MGIRDPFGNAIRILQQGEGRPGGDGLTVPSGKSIVRPTGRSAGCVATAVDSPRPLARGSTVEHLTLDQGVPGSNPGAPANLFGTRRACRVSVTSVAGASPPVSIQTPDLDRERARLHPRDRRRRPARRPASSPRRHALPARAQRLPAHRPRQVDLPELRHRQRVRRPLQPPVRRHEPGQGGAGVHRRDRGGRPLARLRLGRAPVPRVGLLRAALRLGRPPHPAAATRTSTTCPPTRSASTAAR